VCELIYSSGDTFGDLAMPTYLNLPPGCYRTEDQDETTEALEDCRSHIVLKLGLGLLQRDALVRVRHTAEIGVGQRWMEQEWDEHHGGEGSEDGNCNQSPYEPSWSSHRRRTPLWLPPSGASAAVSLSPSAPTGSQVA
jgi:hypothetical protein